MLLARPCIGRMTSGYGRRKHPVTGVWSGHHGVDIAPRIVDKPKKTIVVRAAAGGVVKRRYADKQFGTYGGTLIISHTINGKKYETLYAHLDGFYVSQGQTVKQGQQIGIMGSTGRVTGRHLHFEVHSPSWNNAYSGELDPTKYFVLVPSLGAIGEDVTELQQLLVKHGYKISTDGSFGPATDEALKDFQKQKKLVVDGLAGAATFTELKKAPTVTKPSAPKPVEKPKGEEKLELNKTEREEIARVFKKARESGIFSSDEHEKNIVNGKMTMSRLQYLQTIIAGAGINNGKRILEK